MANSGSDKNHVSFWFWLFALFVMTLPCIGVVMIILWAFVGDNQSRKNYFRAVIVWFLIMSFLWAIVAALGLLPVLAGDLAYWLNQFKH